MPRKNDIALRAQGDQCEAASIDLVESWSPERIVEFTNKLKELCNSGDDDMGFIAYLATVELDRISQKIIKRRKG